MMILLICYFIFLAGFIIYSALGLYHLWRFGYLGDLTKPAVIIYLVIVVTTIVLTLMAISFRSWQQPFPQFSQAGFPLIELLVFIAIIVILVRRSSNNGQ